MLYAVFGRPIEHSRSPFIHQQFAQQEGVDLRYEKRLVSGTLSESWSEFLQEGGTGANVTVPCKTEAFDLCDELSGRALAAGAVNTLFFRQPENICYGDNTDGIGLVRDIARLGVDLRDKKILLYGAGGAVRGVLSPLLQAGAKITITNRTFSKAQNLADNFPVQAVSFDKLEAEFDVIINGTSASLSAQTLPLADDIFAHAYLAYDMVYGAVDTPFIAQAKRAGVYMTADGSGMLVEQAAASYALWRNFTPQTAPVLRLLQEQLRHEAA